jgi:ribosomal small subunit protein bTHX
MLLLRQSISPAGCREQASFSSNQTSGVSMGRGDQRTKRGKISRGTNGKSRPKPKKSRKGKK